MVEVVTVTVTAPVTVLAAGTCHTDSRMKTFSLLDRLRSRCSGQPSVIAGRGAAHFSCLAASGRRCARASDVCPPSDRHGASIATRRVRLSHSQTGDGRRRRRRRHVDNTRQQTGWKTARRSGRRRRRNDGLSPLMDGLFAVVPGTDKAAGRRRTQAPAADAGHWAPGSRTVPDPRTQRWVHPATATPGTETYRLNTLFCWILRSLVPRFYFQCSELTVVPLFNFRCELTEVIFSSAMCWPHRTQVICLSSVSIVLKFTSLSTEQ